MDWNHPKLKSKKNLHRKLFSIEEDAKLRFLVSQYGNKDFKRIAEMMPGRTPRQVRERYKNYLSPEINNGPWSREEDRLLRIKYLEFGPKWSKIAEFFPSRSDINIKNRWTSIGDKKRTETFSISKSPSNSTITVPMTQTTFFHSHNQLVDLRPNPELASTWISPYVMQESKNIEEADLKSNKTEEFCNTEEFDRDISDLFSFPNSIAEEQNFLSFENAFQNWGTL